MRLFRLIPFAAILVVACKSEKPAAPTQQAAEPVTAPAAAAPPVEAQEPAGAPQAEAKIRGVVTLTGQPPAEEKIDMRSDPKCVQLSQGSVTQRYRVQDGKLADVFVWIKSGLPKMERTMPTEVVTLDQQGCVYSPRMVGLQTGQTLEIKNSDPLLHNVHAFGKQEFNIGMPMQGQVTKRMFKKPELLIPVKCDVHPWMEASIAVVDHPFFAVTDASGAFTLSGVPPGTYLIEAVHSKLGARTTEVTVAADAEAAINFEFTGS